MLRRRRIHPQKRPRTIDFHGFPRPVRETTTAGGHQRRWFARKVARLQWRRKRASTSPVQEQRFRLSLRCRTAPAWTAERGGEVKRGLSRRRPTTTNVAWFLRRTGEQTLSSFGGHCRAGRRSCSVEFTASTD